MKRRMIEVTQTHHELRKGLSVVFNDAQCVWEIIDLGTGRVWTRSASGLFDLKRVHRLRASKRGQKAAVMAEVQSAAFKALQSLMDRGITPPVGLRKLADGNAAWLGINRRSAVDRQRDEMWTNITPTQLMKMHLRVCRQCAEAMSPSVLRLDWLCETGKALDKAVKEEMMTA